MESACDNVTIDDCQENRLAKFCLNHASVCAFWFDQGRPHPLRQPHRL
jgi:hypothetical protein